MIVSSAKLGKLQKVDGFEEKSFDNGAQKQLIVKCLLTVK